MTAIDRAEEIARREFGTCNDNVNHDGRQPRWVVEELADAGLLVTDEVKELLDELAARSRLSEWRVWNRELAGLVDRALALCPTCRNQFDGKMPGHHYGSNWDWVPCQTCNGTGRAP